MDNKPGTPRRDGLSIARGIPLADEPGLGALTLPGFLREVVGRYSDREVLMWRGAGHDRGRDGGHGHGRERRTGEVERWSYAELWDRSVEVARALIACGVGKDSRVGILMTNRPEQLAATFGTALAGGVAVLLNTFATPRELDQLLRASGASIVLLERFVAKKDFGAILEELEPAIASAEPGRLVSTRFPFMRRVAVIDDTPTGDPMGAIESWSNFLRTGDATPLELVEAAADTTRPSDLGAIFFSSGTTSEPKGILHSHRAMTIQFWRFCRLMGMEDPVRSWTANGFFWSGNLAMVVGGTLASGGSLLLQPTFEPEEALELMQDEHASFALCWPHQWAKLEGAANWLSVNLEHLRYVKHDTPAARHPSVKTDWLSPPTYGATETLTISTGLASSTPVDLVGDCFGEVLPGNTARIIDPETGEVVPMGDLGEFVIKGPTLMMGYLGIPLDESLDEDGFFHSGDGGYLDEQGRFFWQGRLSDIIKTGGANVSPLEIDSEILTHEAVKLSQTVAVPHQTLGEMVVTCIVLHDGADASEATIRDYAKERLASYKVPRRVLFFTESELEKTGTDKVKTAFLREQSVERLRGTEGVG